MFLAELSPELLRAAAWVGLFGILVVSRHLPLRWAIPIVLVKLLVPLVYFSLDPFGAFHLDDDRHYYYEALQLAHAGYDPVSILTRPFGIPLLYQVAGSRHVIYPWWNLAAISELGPYYFSPVFLNVGLTFVGGWFFARMLSLLGFPRAYGAAALAFFLLHWDIVAWSSFLNLKDTLVMTLTLAALYALLRAQRAPYRGLAWLLVAVVPLGILAATRFYAPFLLLLAAVLHALARGQRGAVRMTVVPAGAFVAYAAWRGMDGFLPALGRLDLAGIPYGLLRFTATPLPWNLTSGYEFLLLPSILNLLFIVPALLAAPRLWERGNGAALPFFYLALVSLLYAAVPDLQGPRQRLQADFVFIWMQFHAMWKLFHYASGRLGGARAANEVDEQAVSAGALARSRPSARA